MDTLEQTVAEADTRALMEHLAAGKPLDPEVYHRIHERGDKIRQEIFEKHGLVDIGVPAIRELRGELPNP